MTPSSWWEPELIPARPVSDRNLDALVASIQSAHCVLVLGPRIAAPASVAGPMCRWPTT